MIGEYLSVSDLPAYLRLEKRVQSMYETVCARGDLVSRMLYKSGYIVSKLPEYIRKKAEWITTLDCSARNQISLTDEELENLFETFPRLQTLRLSGCKLSDKGFQTLGSSEWSKHIVALDLSYTDTQNGALACIAKNRNLRSINLEKCLLINTQGIDALAFQKSLTSLNLNEIEPGSKMRQILTIAQLQELHIRKCKLDVEEFQILGSHTAITFLDLSASNVDDTGLGYVAKMQQLRVLYLQTCPKITPQGFRLLDNHPSLVELHVDGTRADDAILECAATIPTLKVLYYKNKTFRST